MSVFLHSLCIICNERAYLSFKCQPSAYRISQAIDFLYNKQFKFIQNIAVSSFYSFAFRAVQSRISACIRRLQQYTEIIREECAFHRKLHIYHATSCLAAGKYMNTRSFSLNPFLSFSLSFFFCRKR